MTLDATAELLNSSSGIAAVPSQSQCQKQPAMTIKLVGDECVNKVTLITLCDGDGDGDSDGGGGGGGDGGLPVAEHCDPAETV